MTKATIDVLLPVFNGARTIEEAITSLLSQTFNDITITVIDDGSTDRTSELITALARSDKQIRQINQPNRGIVDTLNLGLMQSDSEFVARQDADDISHPSRFQLELDYLRDHPSCIAVSGAVTHIDEGGRRVGLEQQFPQPSTCDPRWAPSREPYLMHPFLMVRRADLIAVGAYRHVCHAEDTDLYWRLLDRGELHNLDEVVGYYRMHQESISGASIINGRIMALNSQLAALSAVRRQERRPDLEFPKSGISQFREAKTLAKMYEIAIRRLDKQYEPRYLRIATAGKLLELTSYRPYELDLDDCQFIQDAREDMPILTAQNRRQFDRLCAAAGARLLQKRLFAEAIRLTPSKLLVPALVRLLAKGVLPNSVYKYISHLRAAR